MCAEAELSSHPDGVQLFLCCCLLFFQPGAQLGADLERQEEGGRYKRHRVKYMTKDVRFNA